MSNPSPLKTWPICLPRRKSNVSPCAPQSRVERGDAPSASGADDLGPGREERAVLVPSDGAGDGIVESRPTDNQKRPSRQDDVSDTRSCSIKKGLKKEQNAPAA